MGPSIEIRLVDAAGPGPAAASTPGGAQGNATTATYANTGPQGIPKGGWPTPAGTPAWGGTRPTQAAAGTPAQAGAAGHLAQITHALGLDRWQAAAGRLSAAAHDLSEAATQHLHNIRDFNPAALIQRFAGFFTTAAQRNAQSVLGQIRSQGSQTLADQILAGHTNFRPQRANQFAGMGGTMGAAAQNSVNAANAAGRAEAIGGLESAAAGTLGVAARAAAPAALVAGAALAALATTVYGTISVVKSWAGTMREQAHALAGFSGSLSGALAMTDVRMMLAEMRRAQSLGPDLSGIERSRAIIDEEIYNIQTRILELLVKFAPFIQTAAMSMQVVGRVVDVHAITFEAAVGYLKKLLGIAEEVAAADPKMDQFMADFMKVPPPRGGV